MHESIATSSGKFFLFIFEGNPKKKITFQDISSKNPLPKTPSF